MTNLTIEKIESILKNVKNGSEIVEYIKELEEHKCKCNDKDHHHDHDDCDCGCHDHEEEWVEIEDKFPKDLTVEQWEKILLDKTCFSEDEKKLLKRFRHVAMQTSAYELADEFGGGGAYWYNELIKNIGNNVAKKLGLNEYINAENWFILFKCWNKPSEDIRYYGLKSELYEAIGNVDMSNVDLWG